MALSAVLLRQGQGWLNQLVSCVQVPDGFDVKGWLESVRNGVEVICLQGVCVVFKKDDGRFVAQYFLDVDWCYEVAYFAVHHVRVEVPRQVVECLGQLW